MNIYGRSDLNYERITIEEWDGAGYTADYYQGNLLNILYYVKYKRSGTTLYLYIYDDALRTNLLDTLTVACSNTALRYLFATCSRDDNVGNTISGYIENLDLQETPAPTGDKNIPNYFNAKYITHH